MHASCEWMYGYSRECESSTGVGGHFLCGVHIHIAFEWKLPLVPARASSHSAFAVSDSLCHNEDSIVLFSLQINA